MNRRKKSNVQNSLRNLTVKEEKGRLSRSLSQRDTNWCLVGSGIPGPENWPEDIQLPGFQHMSTSFPVTMNTKTYPHISKLPLGG